MAGKTKDERFLAAFMSVWSIHKSGEPSEIVLNAYIKSLEEYDIDEIEQAFGYAISDLQWFPKPVELRGFLEHGAGDIEDIALVEADKVVVAIRSEGRYKSVTFDDPVTMAVINQGWGGWIKVCEMREDEIKWFRKDFAKIYKAYSNQGIKQYGHLIGFHEDHNLERFPERVSQPVLIGDEKKALKVLEYTKNKLKLIK